MKQFVPASWKDEYLQVRGKVYDKRYQLFAESGSRTSISMGAVERLLCCPEEDFEKWKGARKSGWSRIEISRRF